MSLGLKSISWESIKESKPCPWSKELSKAITQPYSHMAKQAQAKPIP